MFYVYILFSDKLNKYYVGSTQNLNQRFFQHNHGKTPFTKTGIPWVLVHSMPVENRSQAILLEVKIKKRGIERYLKDINQLSN
ncbi:MAG: GIY-YIG nuclease family protein [Saprospiraceae bacterium]|nr:GIY-YIG nuclease family protein [Saprospiraceae bacterium]